MNITILSIDIKTIPTKNGSYQKAEIAYKNNTFQGKVEGKAIMSFGASKKAFEILSTSSSGDTFDVEIIKNDKGYNDWVGLTKGQAAVANAVPGTAPGKTPTATPKSNYETPEERAQRQVLIVRQSSLSAAVNALTPGSKAALKAQDVIAVAKDFEAYVFGLSTSTDKGSTGHGASGFNDVPDFDPKDFPDVE